MAAVMPSPTKFFVNSNHLFYPTSNPLQVPMYPAQPSYNAKHSNYSRSSANMYSNQQYEENVINGAGYPDLYHQTQFVETEQGYTLFAPSPPTSPFRNHAPLNIYHHSVQNEHVPRRNTGMRPPLHPSTQPIPIQKNPEPFKVSNTNKFTPPSSPPPVSRTSYQNSLSVPTSPLGAPMTWQSGFSSLGSTPKQSAPTTPQLDERQLKSRAQRKLGFGGGDEPQQISPWSKAGEPHTPVRENTQPLSLHFAFPSVLPSAQESHSRSSSGDSVNSSLFSESLFVRNEEPEQAYQRKSEQLSYSYPTYQYNQNSSQFRQFNTQANNQHQDWADNLIRSNGVHSRTFSGNSTNLNTAAKFAAPVPQANGANKSKKFFEKRPAEKRMTEEDCEEKVKEILKYIKDNENKGYKSVKEAVVRSTAVLPDTYYPKIYMELADLAKRENRVEEARHWYTQVNMLDPKSAQGWLEHAKLEEESGELEKCEQLLKDALEIPACKFNEALLIKYIKHQEQQNNIHLARACLARLINVPVEKSWKIVLEGAMLESRVGNIKLARRIYKYLIANVPRHGPIYHEAYRLEEKCEQYENALEIVHAGLEQNPRYGPLWFAVFHILEKLANGGDLSRVREAVQNAVNSISKELVWKVFFESAQIEERAGNLEEARAAYVKSVEHALENLRWKVWLAGARTELNAKNIERARLLLNQALREVPNKSRAVVLIECARLEEYVGQIEKARLFLKRAQQEAKHEWKVFLEAILLEMRAGDMRRAIEEAETALDIHRGTGRLWAVLIQLKHIDGEEEQLKVFKEALEEVPKSGEVWCEGARIRLNPLSKKFNLTKARQYLEFAIKFTPQYGDSLIEYLRLELLQTGPKMEDEENKHIENLCVNADPNYGPLWIHCKEHPLDSIRQVLKRARDLIMKELVQFKNIYQRAIIAKSGLQIPSTDEEAGVERKDFITGLYTLNQKLLSELNPSDEEEEDTIRKKFIFGSELSL